MSRPTSTQRLFLSLLAVILFCAFYASAAVPAPLNTISNLTLPNLNSSLSTMPPPRVVFMDPTHSIYFTEYRHLSPERNYFAAIISMQTSLMAEYFEHRLETLPSGGVSLAVFGVRIFMDNVTGGLTYAMAHRMLGELAEFLMQGNFCAARFELWEIQGSRGGKLSVGWIEPEQIAKTVG